MNRTTEENVSCANCGTASGEVLYELADYMHKTPDTFPMRECNACGLLYLSPRPTQESIMDYYPADYSPYRGAIQDEKLAIIRFMRRSKIVRHRQMVEKNGVVHPGRLLDVGCSTGIFLDEMRSSGWDVQGVELNAGAAQYAQDRLQLSVLVDDLLQIDVQQVGGMASFDAITLWNVLEHNFDPGAVLEQCWRLLKPDGIIAFTIPNWESIDRRLFGRYWIGFDTPRHLFVFPDKTLEEILNGQGFQVVENRCLFGGYYTFIQSIFSVLRTRLTPVTAQKIERLLLFPGLRFPFEPFFMIADGLGMGGIRCVVARKTETYPN